MAAPPQPQGQSQQQQQQQVKGGDWSFLPLVHDIIKGMDKDSQEVHQELNKLKLKFQETRDAISSMPGIDASPEQQQQQRQNLQDQVRIKKELLQNMDKDSQEVHQELNKLKLKFQETRDAISSMPGIDASPEQQQQQRQNLQDQVRIKKELLQKYKSLCIFDVPKQ